jgi:hypothetical protein
MFNNYFAKKAAKKKVKWIAKKESQIALTAVATVVTQDLVRRLIQKAKKSF